MILIGNIYPHPVRVFLCLYTMNPIQQDQNQGALSSELQAALQRRQGASPVQPGGQVSPLQAQPTNQQAIPEPTPQMPFDPAEVKMIEGALINRLKALTEMQLPPEPTPPQGGQMQ